MNRKTVLVVDDDADIREVMRLILEASGYEVIEASDGAAALEVAREHYPGVILLDLMMPGVDGFEFRHRQLHDERLASIPVVVVSGGGGVAEKAAELDAAGYLIKPMDVQLTLSLVARLCPSAD